MPHSVCRIPYAAFRMPHSAFQLLHSVLEIPMPTRPPLRPAGIIFAFAFNLLLVTLALLVGSGLPVGNGMSSSFVAGLPLAGSILAGLATAFYVGKRAAIHALLGGLISVPVLALFVLPGNNWNFAVLAAAFCAMGGILGEFRQRRNK
jgi:hypothetical protein